MLFLTFSGDAASQVSRRPGPLMTIPLVILAALSLFGGFIEIPDTLGGEPILTKFLHMALTPVTMLHVKPGTEGNIQFITSVIALIGIIFAYRYFLHSPQHTGRREKIMQNPIAFAVHCFLFRGWNFDLLYGTFVVRPFLWTARTNKNDFIDFFYRGIALLCRTFNRVLSFTQSGKVRWYAMGIAVGAIVFIGIVEIL
jgi:NADH-quinone oxidoreductase subunit L